MALLQIEQDFLAKFKADKKLNLLTYDKLKRKEVEYRTKDFDNSMKLAEVVYNAEQYFLSEEVSAMFKEAGLKKWKISEFYPNVFEFKSPNGKKYCKAHLAKEHAEAFKEICRENLKVSCSLEAFNAFVAAGCQILEKPVTEESPTTAEDAAAEDANESPTTEGDTIFTLTYKQGDKNIALRIDKALAVHSTNSTNDILAAIDFLKKCINA